MRKLILILGCTVFALPSFARGPNSEHLNSVYAPGESIDDPDVPFDPSSYNIENVKTPRTYTDVMQSVRECRNIWDNAVIHIGNRWGEMWNASTANNIEGHIDPEMIKVSYEKLKYWNTSFDWEFSMHLTKNPTKDSCMKMANHAKSFVDTYVSEWSTNPYFYYGLPSARNQIIP